MNLYRLGMCLKCRGDLAYDDGDWICLQCGVYYYTGLYTDSPGRGAGSGKLRIARQGRTEGEEPGEQLAPAAD